MSDDEGQTGRAGDDTSPPAGGRVLPFPKKPAPVGLERAVLEHLLAAAGEDGEIAAFLREAVLDARRREEARAAEAIAEFELRAEPHPEGIWLHTACSPRRSLGMQGLDLRPVRGLVRWTDGDGLEREDAGRRLSLDDVLLFLTRLFEIFETYLAERVVLEGDGLAPLTLSITGLSWFSGSYRVTGTGEPRVVAVPDLFHSERPHPLREAVRAGTLRELLFRGDREASR